MSNGLDDLESLWRQAAVDAANPQSRLKIAGSLPQTRLVQALYKNAEAIVAGLKAVNGLVDHMDQLHRAISEALDEFDRDLVKRLPHDGRMLPADLKSPTLELRAKIAKLFGNDAPANDLKVKLKVVQ